MTMVAEQAQQHCSALFISTEDNGNVGDAVCIVLISKGRTTQGFKAQHVSACQGSGQEATQRLLDTVRQI